MLCFALSQGCRYATGIFMVSRTNLDENLAINKITEPRAKTRLHEETVIFNHRVHKLLCPARCPAGFTLHKCSVQYTSPMQAVVHLRNVLSNFNPSKSQSSSNVSPTLFKMAQWDVKQSSDRHCNFEADITGLARDRPRIPHLIH